MVLNFVPACMCAVRNCLEVRYLRKSPSVPNTPKYITKVDDSIDKPVVSFFILSSSAEVGLSYSTSLKILRYFYKMANDGNNIFPVWMMSLNTIDRRVLAKFI